MDVVKVEYSVDNAALSATKPIVLAQLYIDNRTSHDQSVSFEVTDETTHTSTYQYKKGLEISSTLKFSGEPSVFLALF